MVYLFAKILMTLATRIFYRKIHLMDASRIPTAGPALLIANHPGSLMDAALLGLLLKRPVHFFARADIFINPFVRGILKRLHMHPVQHYQLGKGTLNSNDNSFEIARQLLTDGELVLFFPEGFSHVDYSLLTFKKGAFRLALQVAEQRSITSMPIIPIGFHYSHPTEAFTDVWIKIGTPINAKNYVAEFQTQPAQTLRKLTDDGSSAIQQLVVATNKNQAGRLFDLFSLLRKDEAFRNLAAAHQLKQAQILAAHLNENEGFQQRELNTYQQQLAVHSISDETLADADAYKNERWYWWLLAPVALIGKLINGLPVQLARILTNKKVRRLDFYAWILVLSAAFFLLFWWLFLVVITWLVFSIPVALLLLCIAVLTGWVWWKTAAFFNSWKAGKQIKKIPGSQLSAIRVQREKLIAAIKFSHV